jgi:RNAse (barnase) inhibitor barstar
VSQPIAELLRSVARASVFTIGANQTEQAFQAAAEANFKACHVDISSARNTTDLLKLLGQALHFPAWYGENWDALADCLSDLSWCNAAGYVLLLHGSETIRRNDPQAFATLLDILRDVSAIWREGDVAFWVLLDTPLDDVPPFPTHA